MAQKSTEAVRRFRERLREQLGDEEYRRRFRDEARIRRRTKPHTMLVGNYKISNEQARFLYEQMQKATCEICGKSRVMFDHDHATGKFRGFLCQACNSGLGVFQDNTELLEKAIVYLRGRSA